MNFCFTQSDCISIDSEVNKSERYNLEAFIRVVHEWSMYPVNVLRGDTTSIVTYYKKESLYSAQLIMIGLRTFAHHMSNCLVG